MTKNVVGQLLRSLSSLLRAIKIDPDGLEHLQSFFSGHWQSML